MLVKIHGGGYRLTVFWETRVYLCSAEREPILVSRGPLTGKLHVIFCSWLVEESLIVWEF